MKEIQDLKIEVTEVKGDIKLINQEISQIKDNHLAHIEKSISNINKIIWTVGILVFAELILLLKHFILG
jgi:archaellum component FlaC